MQDNCPSCCYGVLEDVGFLEIEGGNVQLMLDKYASLQNKEGIILQMCSCESCGYVNLRATAGMRAFINRIFQHRAVEELEKLPE